MTKPLSSAFRVPLFLSAMLLFAIYAPSAFGACVSPAGSAGDVGYNSDFNVMQFCNGTYWINMGANSISGGSAGYAAIWNGTNSVGYNSALYIDTTNHFVGVGTTNPSATLDVSGSVKFGADSTACSSTIRGRIRWNDAAGYYEFCNGTAWGQI